MKVLSAALVTLALLAAGLTGASPATAAPYPHSVPTVCKAVPKPSKTIKVGQTPKVKFRIVAGTAHPRTPVTIKAVKAKKVVWTMKKRYKGKKVLWTLKKLPVGKYKVKYRTSFKATSVYKDCGTKYTLKVVR